QKKAIDKIDDFNVKGLHQLFLARKLLFAQFKIMMPLQITLRLNKALETFKKQSPTVSNSQNRIAKDIRMLYSEDLQEEHWSEPTASYVDFAVPSSKLVIQFDGPHHFLFINGQASLSPQDQAMDFILRHEGWTVLRISYIDWNRIEDRPQNERIAELKRILGQAQH
ncbi:MAG: RAP domain-containing protein, partial [Bdellovibrionia bacterium]